MRIEEMFLDFDGEDQVDLPSADTMALNDSVLKEFDRTSEQTLVRRVDGTIWKIVGDKIVRVMRNADFE